MMTVVPEETTMILICDGCGDTAVSAAIVLPDAEVVWTLVSDHGWSGSPFATGPHRCPRCTPLPGHDGIPLGVDDLDAPAPAPAATAPRSASDALRAALDRAVERNGRLAVDLSGIGQIAASDLGLLVRARQDARQRGVVLCLVAPPVSCSPSCTPCAWTARSRSPTASPRPSGPRPGSSVDSASRSDDRASVPHGMPRPGRGLGWPPGEHAACRRR